jgi:hypothetical protein
MANAGKVRAAGGSLASADRSVFAQNTNGPPQIPELMPRR